VVIPQNVKKVKITAPYCTSKLSMFFYYAISKEGREVLQTLQTPPMLVEITKLSIPDRIDPS
jgi:hypothetical protein